MPAAGRANGLPSHRTYAVVMQLFDRVLGSMREVEVRPRMTVYVCGITPYDAAHLGHAFTYVHFDVLVRYLRHLGSEVVHVQNVTDVDDDILRVARERGVDFQKLADSETRRFEEIMRAIGVSPPTHTPRATTFVPQMVEEVQALVAARCAYERDGWVYFRVAADPGYGSLSRLDRDTMIELAAERGGHPEDPNKDDPLDFVVWQPSAPDEPTWDSPWGPGRPGWHIECSTMARRLLGQPVDIHGGGSDLIFPHHESERAQAEAVGPTPFARHWVHTGTVHQDDEKMSKSLGNMTFVDRLVERHEPAAIRRYLLQRRYRDDCHFDEGKLNVPSARVDGARATREAFFAALDDDLDTPTALAILDAAVEGGHDWVDEGRQVLGLADLQGS
ncbi:MAG TPA: class I tRNA ligase family protein [Actinomycetota bacterium]|nr:class I tRNA ligase family protein [Actinomycetota bacterium]